MYLISCIEERHACAGRRWPARTCQVADSDLSEAQLAELMADPCFTVEHVPDEAPAVDAAAVKRSKALPAPADVPVEASV